MRVYRKGEGEGDIVLGWVASATFGEDLPFLLRTGSWFLEAPQLAMGQVAQPRLIGGGGASREFSGACPLPLHLGEVSSKGSKADRGGQRRVTGRFPSGSSSAGHPGAGWVVDNTSTVRAHCG